MLNFWDLVTYDLGIDLGTSNTLVFIKSKGIMVREPSVIARQKKVSPQGANIGKIIAIGSEAKKMLGKTPETIEAVRPLRDGVISDFDATQAMVKYYIGKIHESQTIIPKIPKPRVIIGIPSGVTEVERRAVQEAALSAGARKAYIIEEPMAAAIGAGLPVMDPQGQLIIDIGGGTTEISVISLGGIVTERCLRIAGDEFDEAIINYLRLRHNLIIGQTTAEEVKIAIGSAVPFVKEKQFVARGRSMEKGLPQSQRVTSTEIREALAPVVAQITSATSELLEETPPELVSDIIKNGIVMAGGGSLLHGI
ncbi:rod shape-determining protein, partial [Candidatus Beckwithbacteria bacterium]|nr:rod shape-determining protein [Candidatus Beckwithbacteria bacterium]